MPTESEISEQVLAQWMKSTLAIAIEGVSRGEKPFGAGVYSPDGSVISLQHNQVNSSNDPLAHAEIRAISVACTTQLRMNLTGLWLVSTAEPCGMCMSAAVIAGIGHIAFGASREVVSEAGYTSVGPNIEEFARQFSLRLVIRANILADNCSALLYNHRQ